MSLLCRGRDNNPQPTPPPSPPPAPSLPWQKMNEQIWTSAKSHGFALTSIVQVINIWLCPQLNHIFITQSQWRKSTWAAVSPTILWTNLLPLEIPPASLAVIPRTWLVWRAEKMPPCGVLILDWIKCPKRERILYVLLWEPFACRDVSLSKQCGSAIRINFEDKCAKWWLSLWPGVGVSCSVLLVITRNYNWGCEKVHIFDMINRD